MAPHVPEETTPKAKAPSFPKPKKTQKFLERHKFDSGDVNAPRVSWCLGRKRFLTRSRVRGDRIEL